MISGVEGACVGGDQFRTVDHVLISPGVTTTEGANLVFLGKRLPWAKLDLRLVPWNAAEESRFRNEELCHTTKQAQKNEV